MRADFYLIAKPRFREEPLLLVCELARKASDAGLATLVLARDTAQAELLDDLLWSFDPDAFIPHQIVGADDDEDALDEADEEVTVLIATPEHDVALRPLVINLRDGAVEGEFERVLEVVPADDSARGPLRERWKQYKARGLEVNSHNM
ncbi:DNA polymerase III subunit chi [Lysobacter sp. A286]